VQIPPLRERGDDVLLLAEHFLAFYARQLGRPVPEISPDARSVLLGYDFPGNVRELKNSMERAVILAEGAVVDTAHLPERMLRRPASAPAAARPAAEVPMSFVPGIDTLESLERRIIREAMARARGVKTEAARLLGISRFQLLRRLEKFGLRIEGNGDGES
jgi:DNA-binding NtrC family response regulator